MDKVPKVDSLQEIIEQMGEENADDEIINSTGSNHDLKVKDDG